MKKNETNTLDRLFTLGKQIIAESDIDRVLAMAMDHLIEISGAERGMIVLFDKDDKDLFQTARNLDKNDIENPKFEISHTIINQVKSSGKPTCFRNAHADRSLRKSDSIARLKILSIICLPLIVRDNVFGVVYLDNRTVEGIFEPEIYTFAQQFSWMKSVK